MAAGATYEPIATTTLGSSAASIDFTSISSAYTDLRVITTVLTTSSSYARIQFNGDTTINYSSTRIYGDGTSAASTRITGSTGIDFRGSSGLSATLPTFITIDVFGYTGSTNKTVLGQYSGDYNGSGATASNVGLWRNTAAITSIKLYLISGNWDAGTTATLYGIKAA